MYTPQKTAETGVLKRWVFIATVCLLICTTFVIMLYVYVQFSKLSDSTSLDTTPLEKNEPPPKPTIEDMDTFLNDVVVSPSESTEEKMTKNMTETKSAEPKNTESDLDRYNSFLESVATE